MRQSAVVAGLSLAFAVGCAIGPIQDPEWRALAVRDRSEASAYAAARAREASAFWVSGILVTAGGAVTAIAGAVEYFGDRRNGRASGDGAAVLIGGLAATAGGVVLIGAGPTISRPWKYVLGVYRAEDQLPTYRARETEARAAGRPGVADHWALGRERLEAWIAETKRELVWPIPGAGFR